MIIDIGGGEIMENHDGTVRACRNRNPSKCQKEFDRLIEKLGITNSFGGMQKTALLGATRILRKVLEM